MTSKEALTFKCRPGYWLRNISNIGERPDWREEVMPQKDSGKLFGYEQREFLAKQYKAA